MPLRRRPSADDFTDIALWKLHFFMLPLNTTRWHLYSKYQSKRTTYFYVLNRFIVPILVKNEYLNIFRCTTLITRAPQSSRFLPCLMLLLWFEPAYGQDGRTAVCRQVKTPCKLTELTVCRCVVIKPLLAIGRFGHPPTRLFCTVRSVLTYCKHHLISHYIVLLRAEFV
jgi:hypothetical protein